MAGCLLSRRDSLFNVFELFSDRSRPLATLLQMVAGKKMLVADDATSSSTFATAINRLYSRFYVISLHIFAVESGRRVVDRFAMYDDYDSLDNHSEAHVSGPILSILPARFQTIMYCMSRKILHAYQYLH